MFTQDMVDLIEILERIQVEYVVVGGFAVNFYGYMRTTQDIDLLIYPSSQNAEKMMRALEAFGFGGAGIPTEAFEAQGTAIHLGVEPNRIDLLTTLQGISLDQVFGQARTVEFQGNRLRMISLEDLLACKRASQRLKDLADAEELEKLKRP